MSGSSASLLTPSLPLIAQQAHEHHIDVLPVDIDVSSLPALLDETKRLVAANGALVASPGVQPDALVVLNAEGPIQEQGARLAPVALADVGGIVDTDAKTRHPCSRVALMQAELADHNAVDLDHEPAMLLVVQVPLEALLERRQRPRLPGAKAEQHQIDIAVHLVQSLHIVALDRAQGHSLALEHGVILHCKT